MGPVPGMSLWVVHVYIPPARPWDAALLTTALELYHIFRIYHPRIITQQIAGSGRTTAGCRMRDAMSGKWDILLLWSSTALHPMGLLGGCKHGQPTTTSPTSGSSQPSLTYYIWKMVACPDLYDAPARQTSGSDRTTAGCKMPTTQIWISYHFPKLICYGELGWARCGGCHCGWSMSTSPQHAHGMQPC